MFEHPIFKWFKFIGAFFAIVLIFFFGIWLLLLVLGYPVDFELFGHKFEFADYVRLLAEGLVAALLLAALAFM